MERKIYYNLAIVATITAIITSIVLVFLFYDFYNYNTIKEHISLSSVFLSILPPMAGVIVFILIFLYLFSYLLTSKIIKPIQIATQNIESILSGKETKDEYIYDELKPFINTINIQKREIELSMLKLREAEKIRRDFTANVSHELKTPLTSINGFAEMLATGMVNKDDTIKFANIIHKEGTRLLGLIDSIISLSHLEDESRDKSFNTINITDIAKDVVSKLDLRIKEKNLDLNLETIDTLIRGNKRMIEDLIYNLVDNAIKYNKPNGKISINIDKLNNYCILKISDTGVGIPKEEQSRIFERFYMVDKSRSKKVGGTGLGLSIVKHIVEYHGGKIMLSSDVDKGTKIEVHLPQ